LLRTFPSPTRIPADASRIPKPAKILEAQGGEIAHPLSALPRIPVIQVRKAKDGAYESNSRDTMRRVL
jgi:hypothetical protein